MANLSFLLPVLALSFLVVFAADATTLQDFCVTNPIGQGIINTHSRVFLYVLIYYEVRNARAAYSNTLFIINPNLNDFH